MTVAALYVETNGVYYGLPDVDPWDEARDARLYAGPWPVVAHPPCQRWCRFAPGIETQYGYKVGDDDGCFEAALDTVLTYGGVIEHPAGSLAWDHFDLPKPQSSHGWSSPLSGRIRQRIVLRRARPLRPPDAKGDMALRIRRRTAAVALGPTARLRAWDVQVGKQAL